MDSIVAADAVARVGDAFVTRTTFNRWFGVAANSDPGTAEAPPIYDPPDFAGCVKLKRADARKSVTDAQLRARCKQEYEGLRDQVMQFLILEKWVSLETLERGTGPSDAELEAAFQKAKKETFPKESDFRKFLAQSGMTVEDARFQVTFNTRYVALRKAAIASIAPVTDQDVATYYRKHKRRFLQPQSRDVRVVLTKTLGRARAALAALRRGRFWRRVALKYSIDQASKHNGGIIRGVGKGTQERAFDRALFDAPKDALRGPVKTQFGYYVFRVFKITPAHQLTRKQASRSIRQVLKSERQADADAKFNRDFQTKWRARTTCREGFLMDQCSNGPPPDPGDLG